MFRVLGTDGPASREAMLGWCVVLIAAVIAAGWDVRTRRIPNLFTLPLLATGLLWAMWTGGLSGAAHAMAGSLLLAVPCFALFLFAGGGAGDVKLLGALGAWLSLRDGIIVLVCVAPAGVVCGVITALLRRRAAMLLSNLTRIAGGFMLAITSRRVQDSQILMPDEKDMQTMPYGVPIFVGVCLAAMGRWLWQW